MKVYGVYYGDSWEGLTLQDDLYFKKETAIEAALKLVASKNEENKKFRECEGDLLDEGEESMWPDFKEVAENAWDSSGYEIRIYEHLVI